MMRAWWCALVVGCAPRQSGPPELAMPDLLQQTLPGVVLLFGPTAKGTVGIGSGVLLEDNRVLTNLHVVEQNAELWVMLHDASRESYTALDGGVARFVTEYGRSALRTRFVRGDAVNDLAMLEVVGDTSGMPTLDFRRSEPLPGETVVALGHPLGNPWSFSRGVVSAVHRGAIQHDAAINIGNSGGPLIDLSGQVVGINTIKLVGGAEGIGYARPFEVVAPLLEVAQWSMLDLSSPEAAYYSANRALELGRGEFLDALDWSFQEPLMVSSIDLAADRAAKELGVDAERLRAGMQQVYTPEYIAAERRAAVELFRGESRENVLMDMLEAQFGDAVEPDELAAVQAYLAELDAHQPEYEPRALEACGLKYSQHRPGAAQDLLKLGTVVEEVRPGRTDAEAWLLSSGMNMDGTPWRCSSLYVLRDGQWLANSAPTEALVASRPEGWPAPPHTFESMQAALVEGLLTGLRHAVEVQRQGTSAVP